MQVRESGVLPYNDEPATDPTHEKKISLSSCGQLFVLTLQVPLYIWQALNSEDWDVTEKMLKARIDEIRFAAAAEGNLTSWGDGLTEFAKRCVYNQFMKRQARVGNHDGHAAPEGWS